ncbi:MAG: efflux RND transporter periplasmic adaptor subunit [Pseudomonadota bacterium]
MKRHLASLALYTLATAAAAADLPAVLDWSQRAVLGVPVSGVIASVSVEPGARVSAGQQLLQLDQRPYESALADAKAQLRKQDLLHDEARRELERTRELYDRTVISAHDLQLGEIAYAVAAADRASARAALAGAQLQHEHSTLQAPFAGIVLTVNVSAGMTVINTQSATPLVTLVQDRPMHARARLPAAALTGLAPGQAAMVTVDGTRFDGSIRNIAAEPDAGGEYILTVAFDPGDRSLRAGVPATIALSR